MLLLLGQLGPAAVVDVQAGSLPLLGRRIVIDPGHGGPDPGACRGALAEEEIVLDLALQLEKMLIAAGADVRLTRRTDTDLSDQVSVERSTSRKRRDILGRVDLVNDWQPDVLLSLHVNAIPATRWRGAQVFYQQASESSSDLAEALQTELQRVLQNTNRQPKPGDYRILNDTEALAVLLEIGFISNPEEAALLAEQGYRCRVAWAILGGLLQWWGTPAGDR